MLKNEWIICFAGEDWWYHNPHSNLHLMKSFSKQNKVLFVNSIGTRVPNIVTDKYFWKRIQNKFKSYLRYFRNPEPNIYVFTPITIPPLKRWIHGIQKINLWLLKFQISILGRFLKIKSPILWVCVPTAKDIALYLRRKNAKSLIYYCVDNISHFEGSLNSYIAKIEEELHTKADTAFFVNHKLVYERQVLNSNTHFLPHGTDYDHFSQIQDEYKTLPQDLKGIPKPIIGYIGEVREVDFELVQQAALLYPHTSFVFVGNLGTATDELNLPKNIYFVGKKAYVQLPHYLYHMSVLTLLYKTNSTFNQYRNPKKLLEYLSTGKPIVSVKIHELESLTDLIYIAQDSSDFLNKLQIALEESSPDLQVKRQSYARAHGWDAAAAKASTHISSNAVTSSNVQAVYQTLSQTLHKSRAYGWDPYDGLTSRLFQKTPLRNSALARLCWIQFFKRNPWNWRPLVGIQPTLNPKSLALILKSNMIMPTAYFDNEELAAKLLKLADTTSHGKAWGYPFDWQAKAFFVPKGTPNIVVTVFAADALLDYLQTEPPSKNAIQQTLDKVVQFILNEMIIQASDHSLYFRYIPHTHTAIHNATLLTTAFLNRYASWNGQSHEPILKKAIHFSTQDIQSDGYWPYGKSSHHRWMDNFHTGFNLIALMKMDKKTLAQNTHWIEKVWQYYWTNCFTNNHIPKYYAHQEYPIDTHTLAVSIITLCQRLEYLNESSQKSSVTSDQIVTRLEHLIQYALNELWNAKSGYFYYEKHRLFTNQIPYTRWSQSWMLLALATYQKMLQTSKSNIMNPTHQEAALCDTKSVH